MTFEINWEAYLIDFVDVITNFKSTKTMSPIDIFGLKNFRIFDEKSGVLEEMSAINILTGANNSGKSSLIKALQMLKNSIKLRSFPFHLDLTEQEHLLGDFDNILFNKDCKELEVSLPFIFLGIKSLYITLIFSVPYSKATYNAKLRAMKVMDYRDKGILFSFAYREATQQEKDSDKENFAIEVADYNRRKEIVQSEKVENIFTATQYFPWPPMENPLTGYVEWSIHLSKLKKYSIELKKFYDEYLKNKKKWKPINEIDEFCRDMVFIPSALTNSFESEVSSEAWTEFIEGVLTDKNEIHGKEPVGERDFDSEDVFYPPPEIDDILYYQSLEILKKNLNWIGINEDKANYSIIENCFKNSLIGLTNRVSTIHYVSNIKEENLRIYNASINSPFIRLLKDYMNVGHNAFINKYLVAFEIGKRIKVEYQPKYQLISVSITTLEGKNRELVDFGYGIKQLILILIQISVLAEKNRRTEHEYNGNDEYLVDYYDPSLLLIEEPESNLHPKWQSLLADMFTEANEKFNIQLIIETHSEYLIRKFQTLVAKKKLYVGSVKIFYLRNLQRLTADKKQVESVSINEDGSINYEIFDNGFFDENDKLELSLLNIQRDRFFDDFEELKKSNKENEDKLIEIQQKIDDYTNKLDITLYSQVISQRFDVQKLSSVSTQYLVSGQFLLHNIDDQSDFSPVIIQYGRAIENEIKEKLFRNVNSTKNWMLGEMQGSLEKQQNGNTSLKTCSNVELFSLTAELLNVFHDSTNLRIDLLEYLRSTRNSAAHSGHTKTKQEAASYIQTSNDFLDKWINELK